MRENDNDLNSFARRHIGPNDAEVAQMLRDVGFENLDTLIEAAIPKNIRLNPQLDLPNAKLESEALAADSGVIARLVTSPIAWVFAGLLALAAFGTRGHLGAGLLSGGALLPAPDGALPQHGRGEAARRDLQDARGQ